MKWHETSEEERKYAEIWLKSTLANVFDYFDTNFFSNEKEELDVENNYPEIIEKIHLKVFTPSNALRQ